MAEPPLDTDWTSEPQAWETQHAPTSTPSETSPGDFSGQATIIGTAQTSDRVLGVDPTMWAGFAVLLGGLLVLVSALQRRRSAPAGLDPQVAGDLEELTERLAAQLDAKAAAVESLLAQAEKTLAHLHAAREAPVRAVRRTLPPIHMAETKLTAIAPAAPAPTADEAHRRVHELADQGLTPVQIARQLGKPTGQVELILNLRRAGLTA